MVHWRKKPKSQKRIEAASAEELAAARAMYRDVLVAGLCVYCGDRAIVADQFVPLNLTLYRLSVGQPGKPGPYVRLPCCEECAELARGRLFGSLAGKAKFLRGKIVKRHRKALALPAGTGAWLPAQAAEQHAALSAERDLTIRRTLWRVTMHPDYPQIVKAMRVKEWPSSADSNGK